MKFLEQCQYYGSAATQMEVKAKDIRLTKEPEKPAVKWINEKAVNMESQQRNHVNQ